MPIVTTYGSDGTKTRRPVGYAGSECEKATLPYEIREIVGQTRKSPTSEMYEDHDTLVPVVEKQKIGG